MKTWRDNPLSGRSGLELIVRTGCMLPDFCPLCRGGGEGRKPISVKFGRDNGAPSMVFGALTGFLGLALWLAFTKQPKRPVFATFFFCARHRRKRRYFVGIPLVLFLASLGAMVYAVIRAGLGNSLPNWMAIPLGGTVLLFGIASLIAHLWTRMWWLRPTLYAGDGVRLTGATPEFLDALPENPRLLDAY